MKIERLLRMTILMLCGIILLSHPHDIVFWGIVLIGIIHSVLLAAKWGLEK